MAAKTPIIRCNPIPATPAARSRVNVSLTILASKCEQSRSRSLAHSQNHPPSNRTPDGGFFVKPTLCCSVRVAVLIKREVAHAACHNEPIANDC